MCSDPSLYDEANLGARTRALDLIAFARELAQAPGRCEGTWAPSREVASAQRRLHEVNERLFRRLRGGIQAGNLAGETLRLEFDRFTLYRAHGTGDGQARIGYDDLDALVHGLLLAEPVPEETRALAPDMVPYEATPARVALELVDRVSLQQGDVFYDLGSGLGHFVLLVHLLSGIPAKGVEFEPAFCQYARRCARDLGLAKVSFLNVDARDADYTDGTVFFLFTPFRGTMLRRVLDKLRCESTRREIKVCTFGACTFSVAEEPWLRSMDGNAGREFSLAVFASRWPAVPGE